MKVKEARGLLEGYSEEGLYQQARKLFREEIDNLITLRSHGKTPSRGVIESSINQVKDWFLKVSEGLDWPRVNMPKDIISWESGDVWVEYGILDPKVDDYRKRTRLEMLKGTPMPAFEALTPESLNAMSSMMLGQIKASATLYLKMEEFAKGMGKRACLFGAEERHCPHQETYSMIEGIPTNTSDLVFVCTTDKCIKDGIQ